MYFGQAPAYKPDEFADINQTLRQIRALALDPKRARMARRLRLLRRIGTWRARVWLAWRKFLAAFRLSPDAVCEMSSELGRFDYHDYPDTELREPFHFCDLQCDRCGKTFTM